MWKINNNINKAKPSLKAGFLILLLLVVVTAIVSVVFQKYIFIPLFLLLVCVSLFVSKKIFNTYFSPLGVMGVTWLLPSLLTFLNPKWELKEETWLVILGSFLVFVVGVFSASLGHKFQGLKLPTITSKKNIEYWDKPFLDKTIAILFCLGIVGFVINMWHIISAGGIKIYFQEGFRAGELIFGSNTLINYLYFLNMVVVPLVVLRTIAYGKNFLLSFIGIISFLMLFSHGIKSTVIMTTVIAFWVLVLVRQRVLLKHIVIVGIIVFAAFILVSVGRDSGQFFTQDFHFTNLLYLGTDRVYHYIVPNYANLQQELLRRNQYLLGKDTFASLIELFSFRQVKPQIQYYLVDEAYNVGTYLRPFVVDFGIAGIIIGPLLIGFLTNFIFLVFLKKPSLFNLFFYAIAITTVTFSFWSPQLLRIQFIYFIVILYFIELVRRTSRKYHKAIKLTLTRYNNG